MRKKRPSHLARAKQMVTTVCVLAIFALPALVSARWMYSVMGGNDPRKVYSETQIASFSNANCSIDTAVQPFTEPLITVTFDDGWESIYPAGLPVLEKHCVKSTQYVLGGHFDDFLYMSEKQVRSMQAAGHEIASHTMTHPNLTLLSTEELTWELGQSHKILNEKFGLVQDFATPLGAHNPQTIEQIKKYYRSHRNTVGDPVEAEDEDINLQPTFDRYNINAYAVRKDTTLDDIQRLINHTIARKGWLVITYHQVDDSGAHYAVTPEMLERQLQLIKQNKVRTFTLGQVLDAITTQGQGH